MKKQLLLLLSAILSFNCYSQINYEKGYFIDDNNQKTNCLIKNLDWKNNPSEFEYKLSESSESENISIKSVKEFGIDNVSKYIRSTVNIDRSSDNLNKLGNNKSPVFEEEELFLKVLVEGKANLYQYVDGNLKRYFYNKDNSNIEQLIYKRYKTNQSNVGENNRFRQQLWNNLKCPNFKISQIENLSYKENKLVEFFTEYSKCQNSSVTNFDSKEKRDLFNLTLRPRLISSSLTVVEASIFDSRITDFDNKIGFGFGIEAEFILPFNKNKWAITIEPTYQSFNTEKSFDFGFAGGIVTGRVDYSSIEMPLGLRHYFFLNNNSKIFIGASYIFDFGLNSSIEFSRDDLLNSLKIDTATNLALGIGYKHNDKYSLEVRFQTDRELLENTPPWSAEYKSFSVIFGYSLF